MHAFNKLRRREQDQRQWSLIAQAVLVLCDGVRDVAAISGELAKTYRAETPEIMADVKEMLGDLAVKHFVVL